MHLFKTRGIQAALFTAALTCLPAATAIASPTASSIEGAASQVSPTIQATAVGNTSLYFDGLLVLLRTPPAITPGQRSRANSRQCLRGLSYELDRQQLKGNAERSPFVEGRPVWPLQTTLNASAESAVLVFDTDSTDHSMIRATLYGGALKHALWSGLIPQPNNHSPQEGLVYCRRLLHRTLAALEDNTVSFGIDPLQASD